MQTAEQPRGALAAATACYLLFVAYQSLAGGGFGACGDALRQHGPALSWADALANFVAYLPLGILAAAWIAPRRSAVAWLLALLAIAGFSLAMELIQSCLAARVSSWLDLAINSAGGLAGLLALSGARREGAGWTGRRAAAGVPPASPLWWPVLALVGAWLATSLAPWRFTLDVGTIRANLAFLLRIAEWAGPDPWVLVRHLSGWLAIGVALRAPWPGRGRATLALALAIAVSLVGQLLLVRPALSFDELAAMAGALALVVALPSGLAGSALARLLPVLALVSVGAYQLQPGPGAMLPAGFEWMPQLGLGGLLSALELSLFFCWLAFALVLSLCWLEARGTDIGRRRLALPAISVGLVLATEIAQLAIPGRVPDSSAPLVTALGFAVAWAIFGPQGLRAPTGPTRRRSAASPPHP